MALIQQRALIEQLKKENQQYAVLHQELLRRKSGGSGSQDEQVVKLEGLIKAYNAKAREEQEQLQVVQQQLELARIQLQQLKAARHQPPQRETQQQADGRAAAARLTATLKERLLLQKQKLNQATAKNRAICAEIEGLQKQGVAAQQHYSRLLKQLAEAAKEAVNLQLLTATTAEAQQEAVSLAEWLRLHNDAEQFSWKQTSQQLTCSGQQRNLGSAYSSLTGSAQLERRRVQDDAHSVANALSAVDGLVTDSAVSGSAAQQHLAAGRNKQLSEGQTGDVLDQLYDVLRVADAADVSGVNQEQNTAADGERADVTIGSKRHRVVQRIGELQEATKRLFLQCSIANLQLANISQQ